MQVQLVVVLVVFCQAVRTQAGTNIVSNTNIVTGTNSNEGTRKESKGAVYVRWGHNSCPAGTEHVFSGYAGGSDWKKGGASNQLCLTSNTTTSSDRRKFKHTGEVYGTQYFLEKPGGGYYTHHRGIAPCAVCQSVHYANSFMFPGSDICPEGWHTEYKGFLMSGYAGDKANQYICIDYSLEIIPRNDTHINDSGTFFYPVIAKCGILKCPPYSEGQQIACAVCTN